jgi:hypothetical protein
MKVCHACDRNPGELAKDHGCWGVLCASCWDWCLELMRRWS